MRIFVIGQTSVHWGRLQFGNIGNYYITETTFRELHRVFPNAEIVTTLQMTDDFCKNENVTCLPLNLFFEWTTDYLDIALKEYSIAEIFHLSGEIIDKTPYIEAIIQSDLIIDFSGELWGDHANPVGKNRFLIGLLKNRVAQLFGKKTVLLAGSQGPFSDKRTIDLAKTVFKNFDLVANRETTSEILLKEFGFNVEKVKNFTDPAFLFEGLPDNKMKEIFEREKLTNNKKPIIGFILCGFNMLEGPYDKWPRRDDEFDQFAESVEFIIKILGAKVILLSHQNGFELPPNFKLINGRDFPYAKGLHDYVKKRGNVNVDDLHLISRPYLPVEVKAIIGKFDMLVTGRIHGFVAAVSQFVPSVIINRGNSPKSLRNLGFAKSVGFEKYLASPSTKEELISAIDDCWKNRYELRNNLKKIMPEVSKNAHSLYDSLTDLFPENKKEQNL